MNPLTNIIHYILNIIQLRLSTKYLSYYYQNAKLGHKIILSPRKSPKSFNLWAKLKKPNKTLLWSLLLHDIVKTRCYIAPLKARCYTALLKLVATRYFLKAHYYTAIFLQNLTKSKCYFGTYFTKLKCYFGTYFIKAQILFWQKQLHYA